MLEMGEMWRCAVMRHVAGAGIGTGTGTGAARRLDPIVDES